MGIITTINRIYFCSVCGRRFGDVDHDPITHQETCPYCGGAYPRVESETRKGDNKGRTP